MGDLVGSVRAVGGLYLPVRWGGDASWGHSTPSEWPIPWWYLPVWGNQWLYCLRGSTVLRAAGRAVKTGTRSQVRVARATVPLHL